MSVAADKTDMAIFKDIVGRVPIIDGVRRIMDKKENRGGGGNAFERFVQPGEIFGRQKSQVLSPMKTPFPLWKRNRSSSHAFLKLVSPFPIQWES
jgi:hypothetical protein